jgi:putative oxidoreductase
MKTKNIILIAIRIVVAIILLQTLFFKFTGHEESVVLFTKLGVEPVGRIATGVIELVASLLILWRRTTWVGALLGIGLMIGAVASHLLVIGIESAGDGGQLFGMAWLVLLLCIVLLYAYRKDWAIWRKFVPFLNS